jgi:hypothetical protein
MRPSSPGRYTSLFLQELGVISGPQEGGLTASPEAASRRPQANDQAKTAPGQRWRPEAGGRRVDDYTWRHLIDVLERRLCNVIV